MKKSFVSSIYAAILIVVSLSVSSCWVVHQNLKVSNNLKEGMTKQEVVQIMGNPAKSEFGNGVEEWHYCRCINKINEYVALFFYEDKLIAKTNYTVFDTYEMASSCDQLIKMGNYTEPDIVIELRSRIRR